MIKISYIDRSQNDIYHRYNDDQHDQSSKISYFSIVEGSTTLPTTRASLPLDKLFYIYIYIKSYHINKLLKEYFEEQVNYNYFIIK